MASATADAEIAGPSRSEALSKVYAMRSEEAIKADMIVAEGVLSFLGLGVPGSIPSWGKMIAEGKEVLDEAPFITLFPSAFMFFTILSFNLLGDHLRSLVERKEGQL